MDIKQSYDDIVVIENVTIRYKRLEKASKVKESFSWSAPEHPYRPYLIGDKSQKFTIIQRTDIPSLQLSRDTMEVKSMPYTNLREPSLRTLTRLSPLTHSVKTLLLGVADTLHC